MPAAVTKRVKKKNKVFYLLLLIFDQLLKYFFRKSSLASINSGLALGLFPGINRFAFCLITFFILFILRFSPFYRHNLRLRPEVNLIFFGGLSNLIDRLFIGGTIDYFHLPLIPSFNLADLAVTLGSLCLLRKFLFNQDNR